MHLFGVFVMGHGMSDATWEVRRPWGTKSKRLNTVTMAEETIEVHQMGLAAEEE